MINNNPQDKTPPRNTSRKTSTKKLWIEISIKIVSRETSTKNYPKKHLHNPKPGDISNKQRWKKHLFHSFSNRAAWDVSQLKKNISTKKNLKRHLYQKN